MHLTMQRSCTTYSPRLLLLRQNPFGANVIYSLFFLSLNLPLFCSGFFFSRFSSIEQVNKIKSNRIKEKKKGRE